MIKIEYKNKTFRIDEPSFQKLSSKGFAKKVAKSTFELEVYEVAFLLEKNKAQVLKQGKDINFNEITKIKGFSLKTYLVFKDLKSKGYDVQAGLRYGFEFRVYDKKDKKNAKHSLWLVEILGDKDAVKIKDLASKSRVAHTTKKNVLLAVVDKEGDITYFENNWKRM